MKQLDLSHNYILDINDCDQVIELPALTCLDLRSNHIETPNAVVPFFSRLPGLNCLYMSKNPCVRKISMYRKNMTMAMPNLYYLDERPVFEAERLTADAFKRGGKEEEERVRLDWANNKKQKEKTNVDRGAQLDTESRETRKSQFKSMMNELKQSKSLELVKEHGELKELWKNEPEGQIKSHYFMKMRKMEDVLKQDWYLKLNEEGKEITP